MKRLLFLLALPLAACTMIESIKTPRSGAGSVKYLCDSGTPVYINYQENGLLLRYKGKNHRLKIAPSASGARYAGDGLVWWNNGPENTLYRLVGEDDTGDRLENCKEAGSKSSRSRTP